MWKRLQNPKGARQQTIGDPFHLKSNLDETTYGSGAGIGSRGQPPPRPPREDGEDTLKGLPRLPLEVSPPPIPQDQESENRPLSSIYTTQRESAFRPASSIYSQPSPAAAADRFPRTSYVNTSGAFEEEESPQISPDLASPAYRYNQQVSPIDEMSEKSRFQSDRPNSKGLDSGIPVLRREKRRNQISNVAANLLPRKDINQITGKNTEYTRFDTYTGEPTTSDRGGRLGVKPGEFSPPALRDANRSAGKAATSINPAGKNHSSFGERVRNLGKTSHNNAIINNTGERPEWKGASGRAAVVSPVADVTDAPPLSIPRRSSKRVSSPDDSGSNTPVSAVRTGASETSPASSKDPTVRQVLATAANGQNSPRDLTTTTSHPPRLGNISEVQSSAKTNRTPVNTSPIEVASTSVHHENNSADTESNLRQTLKNISLSGTKPPVPNDPYEQPPSRFSISTYAPSTAQSTPRPSSDGFDSQAPPMPTPPQTYPSPKQPSLIVNRKRPKALDNNKATTRKEVNSRIQLQTPVFISMREGSIASKRSSMIHKNLPLSPAEAQSNDLITSLEAQLDNLAHRRNNIVRSIRQMTELMPTDNVILTDEVRLKREEEKRKVEGLKEEEADVRRQEHELGLRLHRAYKRRDKEAVYEPTVLWVRRVTTE